MLRLNWSSSGVQIVEETAASSRHSTLHSKGVKFYKIFQNYFENIMP
jgi:hypothetical protein